MRPLIDIGVVLLGYLLGSIPSGLIIVKLKTVKTNQKLSLSCGRALP